MKAEEKTLARSLRRLGLSVGSIAKQIGCSKSSVSKWIRDIPLTAKQINAFKLNQDRGRARAANHPNSPKNKWKGIRDKIIKSSRSEIRGKCSLETLKYIGTALYWAEGYTASRNSVIFANSDPAMIKLIMRFFREVCRIPKEKIKANISIHPHLDVVDSERYWSKISGIPLQQFNKPLLAISRASKGKRDTLPNGTFRIAVSDVVCCSKIKGWIEGIKVWAIGSVG